jgi:hypothetical protein
MKDGRLRISDKRAGQFIEPILERCEGWAIYCPVLRGEGSRMNSDEPLAVSHDLIKEQAVLRNMPQIVYYPPPAGN